MAAVFSTDQKLRLQPVDEIFNEALLASKLGLVKDYKCNQLCGDSGSRSMRVSDAQQICGPLTWTQSVSFLRL